MNMYDNAPSDVCSLRPVIRLFNSISVINLLDNDAKEQEDGYVKYVKITLSSGIQTDFVYTAI